jgi:hypothetical protein
MKRAGVITATAVAVLLAILGCVSKRPSGAQAPKEGKAMVKSLPAEIEGVELAGGTVLAKSGFEWVKQPDGTVTVARMGGVGDVGGSWTCSCTTGAYSCDAVITERSLTCVSRDCLSCKLTVKTGNLTSPIIIY